MSSTNTEPPHLLPCGDSVWGLGKLLGDLRLLVPFLFLPLLLDFLPSLLLRVVGLGGPSALLEGEVTTGLPVIAPVRSNRPSDPNQR